jgi:hypothetical protein
MAGDDELRAPKLPVIELTVIVLSPF